MCSDSNKRRGWEKGEREKSKGKEGEGGWDGAVLTDKCGRKYQEEEKHLCNTRSVLISAFDFHKSSIILNHAGPPLLASYA